MNAQDYEWNFTDNSLWNAKLTTGYYTPTGGSTVSETEPTDSKSIYVNSTGGLTLSSGSHYTLTGSTSNTAEGAAENYIKVEVPTGYSITTSMKVNMNSSNNGYLLIKGSDGTVIKKETTNNKDSFVELKYKNESETAVTAYLYNASSVGSKRNAQVKSIKLTENATVSHKYTVRFTDGANELQDAISGECIETETYTVNVPKVIVKDNAYYVLDNSDGRKDFRETYTMGTADEVKDVTYTKDENVVFFEDYSGDSGVAAASGGATTKTTSGFTIIEALPAGNYEFLTNIFQYSNANRTVHFQIDEQTIEDITEKSGLKTIRFNLTSEGKLSLALATTYTSQKFDYALIRKIGEAVTEKTVEIGAAGYATYVTEYAMDFTNSEVEAYVISGIDMENSKVTLEKAALVPAGEAVIVKGGTANVPVCNSAAVVANLLEHSADDIAYSADAAKTYYVLAKEGDNVVFAPVTSGSIAAGKGYFTVANGAAANTASFRLSFGPGNPTAVDEVQAESGETVKAAYNMAGQRVSANAKGIVIINGKKTYRIQ